MTKAIDLDIYGYHDISINLTVREINDLYKSLIRLVHDIREKNYKIFAKSFIESIERRDIARAYDFFNELFQKDEAIKKHLLLESAYENMDALEQLMNGDEYQASCSTLIDLKVELRILALAMHTRHLLHEIELLQLQEERDNSAIDDWAPPDNFECGTDDEQEIWKDHRKKS